MYDLWSLFRWSYFREPLIHRGCAWMSHFPWIDGTLDPKTSWNRLEDNPWSFSGSKGSNQMDRNTFSCYIAEDAMPYGKMYPEDTRIGSFLTHHFSDLSSVALTTTVKLIRWIEISKRTESWTHLLSPVLVSCSVWTLLLFRRLLLHCPPL